MAHATTSSLTMQDFFTTTLTGNVAVGDTVFSLANVPTGTEGFLVIDPNNPTTREVIYYTAKGTSTVTTPDATANSGRGVGGTSVQTHTSGTLVEMREVAEYWQALQNGQSLTQNAVQAKHLATNAITLGYAQITGSFSTTSTSATQVTGLTTTVTIPAGGRSVKITGYFSSAQNGTSSDGVILTLWDGVVGSGTQIGQYNIANAAGAPNTGATMIAVVTPAAGSKTYNVGTAAFVGGTVTIGAATTSPAFILVEAI